MAEIFKAAMPSRLSFAIAFLAAMAAAGFHAFVFFLSVTGFVTASKYLGTIAHTLTAMPVWVLLGHSISQIAKQGLKAWDDFRG
ncbi:MAG: hypothetical protein ACRCYS_17590 [Beijerinckiaceae bacterium]